MVKILQLSNVIIVRLLFIPVKFDCIKNHEKKCYHITQAFFSARNSAQFKKNPKFTAQRISILHIFISLLHPTAKDKTCMVQAVLLAKINNHINLTYFTQKGQNCMQLWPF